MIRGEAARPRAEPAAGLQRSGDGHAPSPPLPLPPPPPPAPLPLPLPLPLLICCLGCHAVAPEGGVVVLLLFY